MLLMTTEKRGPGKPKLPPGKKRVRLACTVKPETLREFQRLAGPKSNVGRVLDALAGYE